MTECLDELSLDFWLTKAYRTILRTSILHVKSFLKGSHSLTAQAGGHTTSRCEVIWTQSFLVTYIHLHTHTCSVVNDKCVEVCVLDGIQQGVGIPSLSEVAIFSRDWIHCSDSLMQPFEIQLLYFFFYLLTVIYESTCVKLIAIF